MYRAVALWGLRQGVDMGDMHRMEQLALAAEIELSPGRIALNGEDITDAIRTIDVANGASKVSVIPSVRRALVAKQRELIARGDWVAEGRDIGTVVAPEAELKVFLTASAEERARRRAEQIGADPATVLAEQAIRDERDSTREASPLRAAPDAVQVDTTAKDVAAVVDEIARLVASRAS